MHTLVGLLLAVAVAFAGTACTPKPKLAPTVHAPYHQDQIWAVAPFMNESGVSTIRVDVVADAFAEQAQHVQGIDVVPVNRVLLAMQALGLEAISTVDQAEQLLDVLGVDGLILGSITAWDPYPPPTVGVAIQLYMAPGVRFLSEDPDYVVRAPDDRWLGTSGTMPVNPVAQAAGVFNAVDNRTNQAVHTYAETRHPQSSAYGPSLYLVNMELYTEFVAHRLINQLLKDEQQRLMAASEGTLLP